MISLMPRRKRPSWEVDSHAEDTKQRALDLVQQIKKKIDELEPLLADGALDPEEEEHGG